MIISVINMSNGAVRDQDLQRAIRAVNRQIAEDFSSYWGFGSQLREDWTVTLSPRGAGTDRSSGE